MKQFTLPKSPKRYAFSTPAGRLFLQNRIVVIKYGGAAMMSEALKRSFVREVAMIRNSGIKVVIVHGGGKEITAVADKMGLPTTFIQGQRYTDAAMMNVVQMVLAGKINQDVVARLNTISGMAVGLSGIDANLLKVERASGDVDLGFVGEIVSVNASYVHTLLNAGFTPVIAPVGTDDEGQTYNINADVAAAEIARAIGAERLFLLSDVEGVRAGGHVLSSLTETQAEDLIDSGAISSGMIPKIRSAFRALNSGVDGVHLVDGRVPRSIIRDLYAGTSYGTKLISQPHHVPQEMAG